ncbi:MAG: hypothetical protein FJ095_00315 [Deltaproteobacteria bacterium]|nr:hypothetical protein [Deltaproteobacteria bacterium]
MPQATLTPPEAALRADAEVNPADAYRRGAMRWGYFVILNAIAAVVAVAFFVGVFYAESLDPYLQGTYDWLLAHPGATSAMAFSPLAASLLVGYGYAMRARKRKLAAAAREAKAADRRDAETGGDDR